MRKAVLLTLLLCPAVWAEYDFEADANCVSRWRFEVADFDNPSELLLHDIVGPHDLPMAGVTYPEPNTVNHREGLAAVDLEYDSEQHFGLADTYLSDDFPCRDGTTNSTFSITVWFNQESGGTRTLVAKSEAASASFWIRVVSNKIQLCIMGTDWNVIEYPTAVVDGQWYHVGFTYNGATKAYRIRVWDDTAQDMLGADLTGTSTQTVRIGSDPWWVGASMGGTGWGWDGLLDEVTIFNDILTPEEIDLIRIGTPLVTSTTSELFGAGMYSGNRGGLP